MRPTFYSDPDYRKKQSEIAKQYFTLHPRVKSTITRICSNYLCKLPFQTRIPSDPKLYCSHSCAASINNVKRKRFKRINYCLICAIPTKRFYYKYCSLKCQQNYNYRQYITRWKRGLENGTIGITTRNVSAHLRRFLLEKYGEKCSNCGWSQRHPITKKVPLEIDHIDGNSENNKEENLRLICPNCHSLTPCFRNLNKGNGRSWRIKYLKNLETNQSPYNRITINKQPY